MSGRRSRAGLVLMLLLVATYAVWAAQGWFIGPAYSKGRLLSARGEFERAIPHLERAAAGPDRAEALWLAAQVRMGIWQDRLAGNTPLEEMWMLPERSYTEYTEAISLSPALGWFWVSLGGVYHQIERVDRFEQGHPLEFLGQERWAWVGRNGRIAVGLMRFGIEKEPSSHPFHDQLALTLWDYGLSEPALQTVRRSAEVLPIYRLHWYNEVDPIPPPIMDAFAEASRDALGESPFLRRVLHLLALGRIEMRRGNDAQAEFDFRASLDEPGETLNRVEAHYNIGRILAARGQYDEALLALRRAEEHPNFLGLTWFEQGKIAETQGQLEEALRLFRKARRHDRKRLDYAMRYAGVATRLEDWDRAEEALKWASLTHPRSRAPKLALIRLYLETGDRQGAARILEALERIEPDSPEIVEIRDVLRRFPTR